MKTIIATVLFAITAQPAAASDELGAFIAGIITGVITQKIDKKHTDHHHYYQRHPSVTLQPGDRGWNPRVACYSRPEYRHNWVITRWYNCYDEVIRVEKHRR